MYMRQEHISYGLNIDVEFFDDEAQKIANDFNKKIENDANKNNADNKKIGE